MKGKAFQTPAMASERTPQEKGTWKGAGCRLAGVVGGEERDWQEQEVPGGYWDFVLSLCTAAHGLLFFFF